MDRFSEMRAQNTIIEGGGDYNVYIQTAEPEDKNGVWIKQAGSYDNIKFSRYATVPGSWLNPDNYNTITSQRPYAQITANGNLYSFTPSPANSGKFDLTTGEKLGVLNIPSISFGYRTYSYDAIYYDGKIYVFYVTYNEQTIWYYIYDIATNTYTTPVNSGIAGASDSYYRYGSTVLPYGNGKAIILSLGSNSGSGSEAYRNYEIVIDLDTMEFQSTSISGLKYGGQNYSLLDGRIYTYDTKAIRYYDINAKSFFTLYSSNDFLYDKGWIYAVPGYIYIFYYSGSGLLNQWQRYNISTGDIETFETEYSYGLGLRSYGNSSSGMPSNNRVLFDSTTGILLLAGHNTSSDIKTSAMQLVSRGTYNNGDVVITLAGNYKNYTLIESSTGLYVGIENTGIVENDELNGNQLTYWGDGTRWRLLKNPTKETCTVRFNTDGGSSIESQLVVIGKTATEPSSNPTKEGYVFEYWTKDGEEFDFDTIIEEDTTLTAHYISYEEVEYIQSTGTQYIDTEYKPNQNTEVVVDGYLNDAGFLLGVGSAGQYVSFGIRNNASSYYMGRIRKASTANQDIVSSITCNTTRHTLKLNKTGFYIDNTTIGTFNTSYSFSESYSLYAFAWNSLGTAGEFSSSRIYSLKIYDNGTLVRNFQPVKLSTGEYCMLDKVENKLYHNAGTGQFIGEGYEPHYLEYIESTGTFNYGEVTE